MITVGFFVDNIKSSGGIFQIPPLDFMCTY